MLDVCSIIEKTVFLSPNSGLLGTYLERATPRHLCVYETKRCAPHLSATSFFTENAGKIVYSKRGGTSYVWASKPYEPLDEIASHPEITILQNNSLIYRYITDKLSQWRILEQHGDQELAATIRRQMSPEAYDLIWKEDVASRKGTGWLCSSNYGNRGSSFAVGDENNFKGSDALVFRGSRFLDFSIGALQSGVIFEERTVVLPPARIWNDATRNPLQANCVYFDPYIERELDRSRLYHLTQLIGDVLRKFGFRGIFGVDYLCEKESGDIFICEVNPRYTGEIRLLGLPGEDTGSSSNPSNIHTLHILSFLQSKPPTQCTSDELEFEAIGGSKFRFSCNSKSAFFNKIDYKIDGSAYLEAAPPEILSMHTNTGLLSAGKPSS